MGAVRLLLGIRIKYKFCQTCETRRNGFGKLRHVDESAIQAWNECYKSLDSWTCLNNHEHDLTCLCGIPEEAGCTWQWLWVEAGKPCLFFQALVTAHWCCPSESGGLKIDCFDWVLLPLMKNGFILAGDRIVAIGGDIVRVAKFTTFCLRGSCSEGCNLSETFVILLRCQLVTIRCRGSPNIWKISALGAKLIYSQIKDDFWSWRSTFLWVLPLTGGVQCVNSEFHRGCFIFYF